MIGKEGTFVYRVVSGGSCMTHSLAISQFIRGAPSMAHRLTVMITRVLQRCYEGVTSVLQEWCMVVFVRMSVVVSVFLYHCSHLSYTLVAASFAHRTPCSIRCMRDSSNACKSNK
jgi:hypothetical protein